MSNYRRASKAQWFADDYPGSRMDPNVVVLHTTEGASWPSYSGGATAPTYTANPSWLRRRLQWRAHFPDEMSARALQNDAGGVETNTLNCVQVELVGTCAPGTHASWKRQGIKHIYWPNAPKWALKDVARFIVDQHKRHGLKVQGPQTWRPYPDSCGQSNPNRFSMSQWRNFYGVCGHQHVPENDHGDPGAFPWGQVQAMANEMLGKAERRATRVARARGLLEQAVEATKSTSRVRRIRAALKRLPKR